MLRASALYIVIVMALVVGLLCSSLIVVAYFYKLQYQKAFRYERLQNNVASGVNIVLATKADVDEGETTDLFGEDGDPVFLKKVTWGLYDAGAVKAFMQSDTLGKTFLMGNAIDSTKWAALYIIDEDRPLSVSGMIQLKGDVFIPKAGIKEAYVDNKSYQGSRPIVQGKTQNSDKTLPKLGSDRLTRLQDLLKRVKGLRAGGVRDTISNSFFEPTQFIGLGKMVEELRSINASGNVVISSDTTVTIDNTVILENVIVVAPSIVIKKGFKGVCQLFATDSISIGSDCVFDYPSSLGVMRFEQRSVGAPLLLNIGENTWFTGIVFTYDVNNDREKRPLISLGKNTTIQGFIYSQGLLGLKDKVNINGSVFTTRFLYQSAFTRYENYVINTSINADALSRYYLTSDIAPVAQQKQRVLQWLPVK